jgi:hypothetical protein
LAQVNDRDVKDGEGALGIAAPAAFLLNRQRPFVEKSAPLACTRQVAGYWKFLIPHPMVRATHFSD